MSIKKLFLTGFMGLVCGATLVSVHKFYSQTSRTPASFEKPQKPIFGADKQFKNSGKPGSLIGVSLDAIGTIPEQNDQPLTLNATLILNRSIPGNLQYKWMLPPGVNVVSGHISDVIYSPTANQAINIQLTVVGLNKDKISDHIVFHAETILNGVKISGSSVFSLRPDDVVVQNESTGDDNEDSSSSSVAASTNQKVIPMPSMKDIQF